jgi:hypothetical protein
VVCAKTALNTVAEFKTPIVKIGAALYYMSTYNTNSRWSDGVMKSLLFPRPYTNNLVDEVTNAADDINRRRCPIFSNRSATSGSASTSADSRRAHSAAASMSSSSSSSAVAAAPSSSPWSCLIRASARVVTAPNRWRPPSTLRRVCHILDVEVNVTKECLVARNLVLGVVWIADQIDVRLG